MLPRLPREEIEPTTGACGSGRLDQRSWDSGDREQSCPAGSFIYIPVRTVHGFRVGNVPSRKSNFYIPAAMVGYFDELSAAIGRDEAASDALDRIAERYSVEVVGPVPKGYL